MSSETKIFIVLSAGAVGEAISFCDREERPFLADIERLIRKRLPVAPAEAVRSYGLDPRAIMPPGGLPDALYRVDVLSPNEHEAAQLVGSARSQPDALASQLISRGPREVVLKLGAKVIGSCAPKTCR